MVTVDIKFREKHSNKNTAIVELAKAIARQMAEEDFRKEKAA